MAVSAGLMKYRAISSDVSSIAVFKLFYYLLFRVVNTYILFCQILSCKFLPPVLVLLREFLFFWRTVLMLLPSQ